MTKTKRFKRLRRLGSNLTKALAIKLSPSRIADRASMRRIGRSAAKTVINPTTTGFPGVTWAGEFSISQCNPSISPEQRDKAFKAITPGCNIVSGSPEYKQVVESINRPSSPSCLSFEEVKGMVCCFDSPKCNLSGVRKLGPSRPDLVPPPPAAPANSVSLS